MVYIYGICSLCSYLSMEIQFFSTSWWTWETNYLFDIWNKNPGLIPKIGNDGSWIVLSLSSKKTSHCFCNNTPFHIPANFTQVLQWTTSLSVVCFVPYNCYNNRYEVVSHCGFDLYFPDEKWCWEFFYIFVLCISSFKKSIQFLYLNAFFEEIVIPIIC